MADPMGTPAWAGRLVTPTTYEDSLGRTWAWNGTEWELQGVGTAPGTATQQNATARARTSQLLYGAMRGLPYISQEYLAALQGGQTPAPRTMTPQTLAALAGDQFLSDNFFALLEAAGLYPMSFLAEAGRFQPKGAQAAPSFI